MYRFWFELIKI